MMTQVKLLKTKSIWRNILIYPKLKFWSNLFLFFILRNELLSLNIFYRPPITRFKILLNINQLKAASGVSIQKYVVLGLHIYLQSGSGIGSVNMTIKLTANNVSWITLCCTANMYGIMILSIIIFILLRLKIKLI